MSFSHHAIYKRSPYETNPNRYNATPDDFSKGPVNYRLRFPPPDLIAGFSAGNRYLKSRLGVLLAASFQNTYRGNNGLFFESVVVDTLPGVTLTSMKQRNYSEQELRYALYSKIDYKLKGGDKLQWNNAFFTLTDFQVRDTRSTFLTIGGYDSDNGNATLEYDTRSRTTRQNIYSSTLQGDHHLLRDLKLNWSAVYSLAKRDQPDNTTVILNGEENNFTYTKTTVDNGRRRWERNTDRDLSGYLHLTYYKPILSLPVKWTLGGLYRDKKRNNFYNEYEFRPVDPYEKYGEDFIDYRQIRWIVENPRGSVGTSLNYRSFEKTGSGFLQCKATAKRIEAVGGVRIESTSQGYDLDYPAGSRPHGKQVYGM